LRLGVHIEILENVIERLKLCNDVYEWSIEMLSLQLVQSARKLTIKRGSNLLR
jgi:hypothetical protein